ncbi:MAG: DMT family transporter [Calditrichia bacterium]|nr:DMT family transporter [Calditrichia bacterium]
MKKTISKTKADLGLLSVTFFWGTTFIVSKIALTEISLLNYLAIRLTIAAFAMNLIAYRFRKDLNKSTIRDGIIIGIFLFSSYFFQMWGIQYTSASNAGFITGVHVVLVPIFTVWFFKDKPQISSVIGVILAFTGLFLLSGGSLSKLNIGDFLVFICAITVTFHVIYTGKFAPKHNIYLLTAVQLSTTSILSIIFLFFSTNLLIEITFNIFAVLTYLALFGTVFTFLMQTAMQRFTTSTRTALVFSMEPVFAALFAYLIAGEMLTPLGWVGGLLILAGMIIAEINWKMLFK